MKTKHLLNFAILAILLCTFDACKKDDKADTTPLSSTIVTSPGEPITDIDGNVYQTIKIGNQTWMAENLKTTRYRDGYYIAEILVNSDWADAFIASEGKFCRYNNNIDSGDIYGFLYDGIAANSPKNIAPEGWRLPTEEDWNTLENYLGGSTVAGGKLKEIGFTHWENPNTGADNESNFNALGAGYRFVDGEFRDIRLQAKWWVAATNGPLSRTVFFDSPAINSGTCVPQYGFSIRCIKEE